MTATVIEMVKQCAKADGMNRLVLHGKDGKFLYDSTWIAGEDYSDDIYDNIKTQTMRTLSNKTLILNQIMKIQKVKRNHFNPEHKKAQKAIQKAKFKSRRRCI